MISLLILIYVAFISLGLPDSLLGSAWPSMYAGLGASIDAAGAVSIISSSGTIISSLLSARLINRFGTGAVTAVSVALTAAALFGYSTASSVGELMVYAVPLGLGGGSVDAALNNYVALRYKAKHMSWLHCFWGIGASLGPVIMAFCLRQFQSWNSGYRTISIIQFCLMAVLFATLGLWKRADGTLSSGSSGSVAITPHGAESDTARSRDAEHGTAREKPLPITRLIGLRGAKPVLTAFFCYCAIESVVGLWGTSFLVTVRGVEPVVAAGWISLYYFGVTFGRFLSGFVAIKLKPRHMIYIGESVLLLGAVILALSPDIGNPSLTGLINITRYLPLAALFLIGLGCAPIYPSFIHDTPENFGRRRSASMIGLQMASAYTGSTFAPPLFGFLYANFGYSLLPASVALLLAIMTLSTYILYRNPTATT